MKAVIIVGLLFVSSTLAHLCLISPVQRGSMDGWQTVVAADDCFLNFGPCGGRDASAPVLYAESGSNFTIVWSKNLDHYYAANPGNFTVRWAESVNAPFEIIGVVPDTPEPSLTLYALEVQLPSTPVKHGVLQVVYYSQNPVTSIGFYQCADMGRI